MLTISNKAIEAIIAAEISSEAYYNKFLAAPSWPTGQSGVTIGIGYDLGYNTKQQISNDWKGLVSEPFLTYMQSVAGLKGLAAKSKTTKLFKVPLDIARKVFTEKTLPRYCKDTLTAYPTADQLTPNAFGALVMLVFNRGSSFGTMGKPSWNSRKEMRELAPLITAKNYPAIAAKIREMKRLWDGLDDATGKRNESETRITALLLRRDVEADLIINTTVADTTTIVF